MTDWSTDVATTVAVDGTVAFTGFYGDYAVDVGGKTLAFTLTRGTTDYQLR